MVVPLPVIDPALLALSTQRQVHNSDVDGPRGDPFGSVVSVPSRSNPTARAAAAAAAPSQAGRGRISSRSASPHARSHTSVRSRSPLARALGLSAASRNPPAPARNSAAPAPARGPATAPARGPATACGPARGPARVPAARVPAARVPAARAHSRSASPQARVTAACAPAARVPTAHAHSCSASPQARENINAHLRQAPTNPNGLLTHIVVVVDDLRQRLDAIEDSHENSQVDRQTRDPPCHGGFAARGASTRAKRSAIRRRPRHTDEQSEDEELERAAEEPEEDLGNLPCSPPLRRSHNPGHSEAQMCPLVCSLL